MPIEKKDKKPIHEFKKSVPDIDYKHPADNKMKKATNFKD